MFTTYNITLIITIFLISNNGWSLENPWSKITTPATGDAKIIGSYSAGCIQGAVSILSDTGTFEIMRQSRRRYFAHPQLRQFIIWFAKSIYNQGYGKLLVGDLGQARGGPTTTGHASHQIGLDADFWFWLESNKLTSYDKEHLSAPSMLNSSQTKVNFTRLGNAQIQVLKMAATHPQVERIFVHPLIKQAVCKRTNSATWLRKIRPWFGHHYHFHVRLACPSDQPKCKAQEPVPETDGCGEELDSWLHPKAQENDDKESTAERKLTPEQRLAIKLNRVPAECATILHSD